MEFKQIHKYKWEAFIDKKHVGIIKYNILDKWCFYQEYSIKVLYASDLKEIYNFLISLEWEKVESK